MTQNAVNQISQSFTDRVFTSLLDAGVAPGTATELIENGLVADLIAEGDSDN